MRYTLYMLPLLLLFSCEKEEPQEGPGIGEYYGDFEFVSPFEMSTRVVDFDDHAVEFTASFSIKTWWKIEITGMQSGATKVLGAKSNSLETEGEWIGTADDVFFQHEDVIVELSFRDYPEHVFIDTISITDPLDYSALGTVLTTMDDSLGLLPYGKLTYDTATKAEGDAAIFLNGEETGNLWWLNGLAMPSIAPYQLPGTDPAEVYFNAFVYGTGSGSTKVVASFKEDDDLNKEHTSADDSWEYPIVVDWTGWRLISFPMNETIETTDNDYGNGNGIRELDRIVSVEFGLYSTNGQADPSIKSVGLDHPIFTIGPLSSTY